MKFAHVEGHTDLTYTDDGLCVEYLIAVFSYVWVPYQLTVGFYFV